MHGMNRRGDLASGLLPIVALIMCVLALFIFITFNEHLGDQSEKISEVLGGVGFAEKFIEAETRVIAMESIKGVDSSEQAKVRFIEIASKRDLGITGAKDFFDKVRAGEFIIIKTADGYGFKMEDVVVSSEIEGNALIRKISLNFEVNAKEEIS